MLSPRPTAPRRTFRPNNTKRRSQVGLQDYEDLLKIDPRFVNMTNYEIAKAKAAEEFEKKKDEVVTQLKGLGNSILG